MTYHVQARNLVATPTAVIRARVPRERIAGWLGYAYRLVGGRLASEGIVTAGPAFACYTGMDDHVEVEAGYPVAVAVAVAGDSVVVPSGLPGGAAAVTVHEGPLEFLDVAYQQIERWLTARGFAPNGRHWERYLAGVATDDGEPSRWRTELIVPYCWTRWVPMTAPERSVGSSAAMLVSVGG